MKRAVAVLFGAGLISALVLLSPGESIENQPSSSSVSLTGFETVAVGVRGAPYVERVRSKARVRSTAHRPTWPDDWPSLVPVHSTSLEGGTQNEGGTTEGSHRVPGTQPSSHPLSFARTLEILLEVSEQCAHDPENPHCGSFREFLRDVSSDCAADPTDEACEGPLLSLVLVASLVPEECAQDSESLPCEDLANQIMNFTAARMDEKISGVVVDDVDPPDPPGRPQGPDSQPDSLEPFRLQLRASSPPGSPPVETPAATLPPGSAPGETPTATFTIRDDDGWPIPDSNVVIFVDGASVSAGRTGDEGTVRIDYDAVPIPYGTHVQVIGVRGGYALVAPGGLPDVPPELRQRDYRDGSLGFIIWGRTETIDVRVEDLGQGSTMTRVDRSMGKGSPALDMMGPRTLRERLSIETRENTERGLVYEDPDLQPPDPTEMPICTGPPTCSVCVEEGPCPTSPQALAFPHTVPLTVTLTDLHGEEHELDVGYLEVLLDATSSDESADLETAFWPRMNHVIQDYHGDASEIVTRDLGDDPLLFGGPSGRSEDADVEIVITSTGGSTGAVLTMYLFNNGKPLEMKADLVVLEPIEDPDAETLERAEEIQRMATDSPLRGSGTAIDPWLPFGMPVVTQIAIDGYCLEYDKEVPQEGMLFRLADPTTQMAYAETRALIVASRELRDAGALHPDSNPDDYFHSIRQWAIWVQEKDLDLDGYQATFVEHTKKNFEAAGEPWSDEVETLLNQLIPNRWSDIEAIHEAARTRTAGTR